MSKRTDSRAAALKAKRIEVEENILRDIKYLKTSKKKRVEIFKKDVNRFRALGNGDFKKGFYHMMEVCEELCIQPKELVELIEAGDGDGRVGFVRVLKLWLDNKPDSE